MFGLRDAAFLIESLLKTTAASVQVYGNVPGWPNALMVSQPSMPGTCPDAFYNSLASRLYPLSLRPRHPSDNLEPTKSVQLASNNGTIGLPLERAVAGDTTSLGQARKPVSNSPTVVGPASCHRSSLRCSLLKLPASIQAWLRSTPALGGGSSTIASSSDTANDTCSSAAEGIGVSRRRNTRRDGILITFLQFAEDELPVPSPSPFPEPDNDLQLLLLPSTLGHALSVLVSFCRRIRLATFCHCDVTCEHRTRLPPGCSKDERVFLYRISSVVVASHAASASITSSASCASTTSTFFFASAPCPLGTPSWNHWAVGGPRHALPAPCLLRLLPPACGTLVVLVDRRGHMHIQIEYR
ncbi:hypothetical protein BGW80DRAFT_1499069 [Lactifluus volemus]|nr:hypothetical protein BGW80DRAFT_1499069 [Lactifluus volemus]